MTERVLGSPLSMHDPHQVGPWALHSRLGAGGMGVVFQATSPEHGTAALKVIRPGLLDAPATRDRFRREVAILKSVRDEHICQYLAADIESEPAWLALEYVAGPTLREEVTDRGPLSEDRWWDLARGMAQALAILDVHRITHRDLKPGNVILHDRGAVLIDFGIAHPEDATSLTATGLVTGSPAWLSPEQATLEPVGPASDIFALGSMLAYAATGRPPFGEGASVAVLMSIATREPDLVGVDPNRAALLLRMLSKDPVRRPTARQVLDRLRGHGTSPQAVLLDAAPASAPGLPPTSPTVVAPAPTAVPDADPAGAPTVVTPVPPMTANAQTGTQAEPGLPGIVLPANSDATRVAPPARTSPAPPPVRPRTAPRRSAPTAAPRSRSGRGWLGLVVLGIAILLGGWLLLNNLGGGDASSPGAETGGAATGEASNPNQAESAGDAPAAPSSDQLSSGDWLLSPYRLENDANGLTVTGTLLNRGTDTASTDLTLWVYLGSESLGSVSTTVSDVPAGGTEQVTMTGDAVWKPGTKVVLLEAS